MSDQRAIPTHVDNAFTPFLWGEGLDSCHICGNGFSPSCQFSSLALDVCGERTGSFCVYMQTLTVNGPHNTMPQLQIQNDDV